MATITYNANGGYYAPAPQTFSGYTTITTSTPSRTGYTFLGWGLNSVTSTVTYAPGSTYSGGDITLYAVWKINTYTITYNANGGTGAPSSQTKTYGQRIYLSSQEPTRSGYEFQGWSTTAYNMSGAISYYPGSAYSGNADLTLYAVWLLDNTDIVLYNCSADRCTSSGTFSENGTYAKVTGEFTSRSGSPTIKIEYRLSSSTGSYTTARTLSPGQTGGSFSAIVGGSLDINSSYTFRITASYGGNSTEQITTLASRVYVIDFMSGGEGLTIGGAATSDGLTVEWESDFNQPVNVNSQLNVSNIATFDGNVIMQGAVCNMAGLSSYVILPETIYYNSYPFLSPSGSSSPMFVNNLRLDNGQYIQFGNTSGSFQNFMRMNTSNQFEMTWTSSYPIMGDMGDVLFSGTWNPATSTSTNSSRTISGATKYRVFLIMMASYGDASTSDSTAANNTWIVAARGLATQNSYRIAGGAISPNSNPTAHSLWYSAVFITCTGNTWNLRSAAMIGVLDNGNGSLSSASGWTRMSVRRIVGLI